jgi:hypothetical protein
VNSGTIETEHVVGVHGGRDLLDCCSTMAGGQD